MKRRTESTRVGVSAAWRQPQPAAKGRLLGASSAGPLTRVGALGLAVLILFIGFASVSPAIHELIHHAASDARHYCLITKWQQSTVVCAEGQVSLIPALEVAFLFLAPESIIFSGFDYDSPPERAPPLRASIPVV